MTDDSHSDVKAMNDLTPTEIKGIRMGLRAGLRLNAKSVDALCDMALRCEQLEAEINNKGGWRELCKGHETAIARLERELAEARRELYILFDGPPSHESGRFVKVEDGHGHSVNAGEWQKRDDGLWALVIPRVHDGELKGLEAALQLCVAKTDRDSRLPIDLRIRERITAIRSRQSCGEGMSEEGS